MVLVRTLLALALVGCVKSTAPIQAPSPGQVATTISLATMQSAHGEALPEELSGVLQDALKARNLELKLVQAPGSFAQRHLTAHRLAWLVDHSDGAPMALMLELNARRYDNLGGRYRWVVDVTLTLAPTGQPTAAQTKRFSVPVHLRHAHQGATEAAAASLPLLRRRLEAALNSFMAGTATP